MQWNCAVYVDVNQVFEYAYRSDKLLDIQGATVLLDVLNRTRGSVLVAKHEGILLSAGGGELRALFHCKKKAECFFKNLQLEYAHYTHQGVSLSLGLAMRNEGESLRELFERATALLRLNEASRDFPELQWPKLYPLSATCSACGERPVDCGDPQLTESGELCATCRAKRQSGRHLAYLVKETSEGNTGGGANSAENWASNRWLQNVFRNSRILSKENGDIERVLESLVIDVYRFNPDVFKDYLDSDVEALKGKSEEGSRLAVLYIDGDNMGKFFGTLGSSFEEDCDFIKAYQVASEVVQKCTVRALNETVQGFAKGDPDPKPEFGLRVLMIGGDDTVVMVPAQFGIPFAEQFVDRFCVLVNQEMMSELELAGLSAKGGNASLPVLFASAGVVMAPGSYPIYRLFQTSYSVCSHCKVGKRTSHSPDEDIAREETAKSNARVNYYNLNANSPVDYDRALSEESWRVKGHVWTLYSRPFTLQQIKTLQATVVALHNAGFPRAKMKEVYRLLRLTPIQSGFAWRQWWYHLDDPLRLILKEWYVQMKSGGPSTSTEWDETKLPDTPWMDRASGADDNHVTPFPDLFDLYDYLRHNAVEATSIGDLVGGQENGV